MPFSLLRRRRRRRRAHTHIHIAWDYHSAQPKAFQRRRRPSPTTSAKSNRHRLSLFAISLSLSLPPPFELLNPFRPSMTDVVVVGRRKREREFFCVLISTTTKTPFPMVWYLHATRSERLLSLSFVCYSLQHLVNAKMGGGSGVVVGGGNENQGDSSTV